ncbi:aminotransferase class IV [Streptomyces bambusae]|uniref:Aminotransferase class IV n=1 Tax=Streptomyces bambusae TaxID=1550616 RepID=A0ABS6ZEB5_9ACTN|nr:aminotransferase class IV [Streptomyces bambusae]MBW5485754.1 aminotransferase class IV [Streptomyces bambusae]
MARERVWEYGPDGLAETGPPAVGGELRAVGGAIEVADSWLVEDGRVRSLEGHRRRFAAGVREVSGRDVTDFWDAVVAQLPREGDWFPRVELAGGTLRLRLRGTPERTRTVRLWPTYEDPRRAPRRKGPDLAALGGLITRARSEGADNALLLSPEGLVLEAATATLVWWEGPQLCVVDPELPVLEGVTAGWIVARAAALGVPVRTRRARPAELDGCETWVVNALHGIRAVTGWSGAGVTAGPATRAQEWHEAWLASAEPLPPR